MLSKGGEAIGGKKLALVMGRFLEGGRDAGDKGCGRGYPRHGSEKPVKIQSCKEFGGGA